MDTITKIYKKINIIRSPYMEILLRITIIIASYLQFWFTGNVISVNSHW